jgi:hypothetical protein
MLHFQTHLVHPRPLYSCLGGAETPGKAGTGLTGLKAGLTGLKPKVFNL